MLSNVGSVVLDVARSRWFSLLGPCLFLPLFERRTVLPIAFGVFLLGSARYDAMYLYGAYYPLPLVPFCLMGVLLVAARKSWKAWALPIAAVALMSFSVINGKAPYTGPFSSLRHNEIRDLGAKLMAQPRPVLVQTVLYPHIGYSTSFFPLWEIGQCSANRNLALFDLTDRNYPMESEKVKKYIETQMTSGAVQLLPSGTVALVDCEKTVPFSL
jgi:hypothetical protein